MNKKLLMYGGGGAAILLILLGISYFIYSGNKTSAPKVPANQKSVPVITAPAVNRLVEQAVISPVLSFDGNTIWYLTVDGRMFREPIDKSTAAQEYPFKQGLTDPLQIVWPKTGSNFLAAQNASGHIRYSYYDANSQTFTSLADGTREPQFLSGSDKIVYDWVTAALLHQLKTANPDGTNFQKVADLIRSDYHLTASPSQPAVALFTSDQSNPSKLHLVDLITSKFQDLGDKAAYQGVRFSPDGNKILAAGYTNAGGIPDLVLFDLGTSQMTDLKIFATIDQTVWSPDNKSIIVGSSRGFAKYDLTGQSAQTLYQFKDQENFQPTNLILHPQKPLLFFVDQKTGYLYTLNLP